MGATDLADEGSDIDGERRGTGERTGVGQGSFGQRNGGKGMGTGRLFVFIPLPPFLCQFSFGNWDQNPCRLRNVRRTAIAADMRRFRATERRSLGPNCWAGGGGRLAGSHRVWFEHAPREEMVRVS